MGPDQKLTLSRLARIPEIEEHFFLTGGTALAVFYLGHRTSEDLDFFSTETLDLSEFLHRISLAFPEEISSTRSADLFASILIRGVKVDFVCDQSSRPGPRPHAILGGEAILSVDTVENIASNKLTAMVSRTEIKDFIDFYFIGRSYPMIELDSLLLEAQSKERLFEDPSSAAFQIESAAASLRKALGQDPAALGKKEGIDAPGMIKPIDLKEFWRFFEDLAGRLYRRGAENF
ncbi:MAG: nucleotidyl transferase AbiEii/AbiGii toxin family protein [Acidobacteriota bacterium]|nr:nucleotidyl transferase AbiEii/AbiGii toxin family protein [Acidobacteriota bacterium]